MFAQVLERGGQPESAAWRGQCALEEDGVSAQVLERGGRPESVAWRRQQPRPEQAGLLAAVGVQSSRPATICPRAHAAAGVLGGPLSALQHQRPAAPGEETGGPPPENLPGMLPCMAAGCGTLAGPLI